MPIIAEGAGSDPTRTPSRKEVWGNGPIVNRSYVVITVDEGFEDMDDFLSMTGTGYDLFYDPNYQWKEGGKKNYDLPYGNETFIASYPEGYEDKVKISFIHYYQDENFGSSTLQCLDINFNSQVYGLEYFEITIYAENRSGISKATLALRIENINDPPRRVSGEDFFSIAIDEDSSFNGVNKKHMMPDQIFGDPADPLDILTYKVEPQNELAEHIVVDCEIDGSNISFTPEEDWCSPYLPTNQRLSGDNLKGWEKYFAHFMFNVTDQTGSRVPEREGKFFVYVNPVNDEPTLDPLGDAVFDEDSLVRIQFTGDDPDLPYDQSLRYSHNLTASVFQATGQQIEFVEGADYSFDPVKGIIQFKCNNDMVGSFDVMAYVKDRSTLEQTPLDYPPTPYNIYSNFTLVIRNVNDRPNARILSPSPGFPYDTTTPIEFNGSASRDPDLIHGEVLNYTWSLNGKVLGHDVVLKMIVPLEGFYNVTLNVSDGKAFSLDHRNIQVKKTRIYGEIFKGKPIDGEYSDPADDQLVLREENEKVGILYGGYDSIDVLSLRGKKSGESSYQISVRFGSPLDFVYTGDKTQDPTLNIYFMKPGYTEEPPLVTPDKVRGYDFSHPPAGYRYARLEIDLRTREVVYSNVQIYPQVLTASDRMGVEVTLTLVELDQLGVLPDFKLFARAYLYTVITNSNNLVTKIKSYDTVGHNSSAPVSVPTETGGQEEENGGLTAGAIAVIGIVAIVLLALVVIIALALVIMRKKGPEPKPEVEEVQQTDELDQLLQGRVASAPAPQPQPIGPVAAPQGTPTAPVPSDTLSAGEVPSPEDVKQG